MSFDGDLPSGFKQTEIGPIPEDWEVSSVGKIATFEGGTQPPRSTFVFKERRNYVRLIQIRDYKTNEYKTFIPVELAKNRCSADEIMIGRYGPPVFQILRGIAGSYNVALIKASPEHGVDREYLFYILKQESLLNLIEGLSQRSSGQTGIEMPALKAFPVPLPPLPEQQAIAEALSDVDGLIAELEALLAKKRDLKQATAQTLLTAQTRLPGFDGAWREVKLGEIVTLHNGYAFKSATYDPIGQYKIVTISNVQSGTLNKQFEARIAALPNDLQPHHTLSKGDILISMTGNVGRVCIVDEENCLLNQRVGMIRPISARASFIMHLLQLRDFTCAMELEATGGAQGNLSKSQILAYVCKTPSELEEQTAIADALLDMDAEINALEAQLAKTRDLKTGMMQDLLTGRVRLTGTSERPKQGQAA